MRTISTIVFLSIAALGFAGCESQQTVRAERDAMTEQGPIETDTATLVVHGMGCPLCANNVDKQLLTVPGVRDVNIDMGTGRVTVHLDESPRPTRQQLARAIDDSGFTLVSIHTP